MAKAKRIRLLKKQKSELIQDGINFLTASKDEADFFIVTVPGVGSVDVTNKVKRRLAS